MIKIGLNCKKQQIKQNWCDKSFDIIKKNNKFVATINSKESNMCKFLISYLFMDLMVGTVSYVLAALLLLSLAALVVVSVLFLKQRKKMHTECMRTRSEDEIKSTFLTHISNALKMPLKTINENCNKLQGKDGIGLSEEERLKLISNIHKNSHQMFTYLNEIQELTNFDGSVPAISMIEVNLAELIMSYRREILHEAHRGVMVGIRTNMSPHCKATLDTPMFRQLIMHLLRISARRTKEGSITISYDWEREGLHFQIEDTGGGLPDEYKGVIFKQMLPEDYVLSPECQSVAISVRICKSIVDSLKGTIEARSSEEERGVIFDFWFPCYVRFN